MKFGLKKHPKYTLCGKFLSKKLQDEALTFIFKNYPKYAAGNVINYFHKKASTSAHMLKSPVPTFAKKPSRSLGLVTSQFPLLFRHVILLGYKIGTEVEQWPPISSLVPEHTQIVPAMSSAELLKGVRECLPSCETLATSCMVQLDENST